MAWMPLKLTILPSLYAQRSATVPCSCPAYALNCLIKADLARSLKAIRGFLCINACRVADPRYPMIAMAPEGTCGDGRCILKFRTGAFVAGAPVLPVLFKYCDKGVNPAWGILNLGFHVVRMMNSVHLAQMVGCTVKCVRMVLCSVFICSLYSASSRRLKCGGMCQASTEHEYRGFREREPQKLL